jgi:outer membrane protein assembly factor BamB
MSLWVVWLLLGAACEMTTAPVAAPTVTPLLPPRSIVNNSLGLVEQWRFLTGPSNGYPLTFSLISVTENRVLVSFFAGDNLEVHDSYLTALSLEDGHVIWQTRFEDPDFGTIIHDVALDPKARKIYLIYSFRVSGFDLETGKQLWITRDLGGHTAYRFEPGVIDPVRLRSSASQYIDIDPRTGKVLSRKKFDEPLLTIRNEYVSISQVEDKGLVGIDRSTGQQLWGYERLRVEYLPVFVDDNVLAEHGSAIYRLFCFNAYTGETVWETEREYISNYAVSGKRVYAITQDGRLITLNLKNGQSIGEMKFGPEPTGIGTKKFWITINEPYVLVYLDDSQELIAFKKGGS